MKQTPRMPAKGMARASATVSARSFNASCLIYCYESIGP
jgi:hypothetical protein